MPACRRPIKERPAIDEYCMHSIVLTNLVQDRWDGPIGFCADIGAPRPVVGSRELQRILVHIGRPHPHLNPSRNSFRFADEVYDSRGTAEIPLETTPHVENIQVILDVVTADISALLGMDTMGKKSFTPCIVTNSLVKRMRDDDNGAQCIDVWSMELKRSTSNHLYSRICTPAASFFGRARLIKLHRNFFHPRATKLFSLIKRARPEHATAETLKAMEEIKKRCDPC